MENLRKLAEKIRREHITAAIEDLDQERPHAFGPSTYYDLLYKGKRYPPKAAFGLAYGKVYGTSLGPYDFKGGLQTVCFITLQTNDFQIITKASYRPFPEEVDASESHTEGAVTQVLVNKYERDSSARAKAILHYGPRCIVCGFDFEAVFGEIGSGFIHVHHLILISSIGRQYKIDPVQDLRPVCPNCHAMLHKSNPPYSIEQLQQVRKALKKQSQ